MEGLLPSSQRRLIHLARPFLGGREGIAMLNRTNRTLSANLNRLNLGTRSLVLTTGVNNGDSTLRVRHAHAHVYAMRDGMFRSSYPSILNASWVSIPPTIPCSSPVTPWPGQDRPSFVVSHRVVVPVIRSVDVVGSSINQVDGFDQTSRDQDQDQSQALSLKPKGSAKADRKPFSGKRTESGSVLGKCLTERTTESAAAAINAAAAG